MQFQIFLITYGNQVCLFIASSMTCYLPSYEITEVNGFSKEEIERYMEVIRSAANLIIEFSKDGGFEHASGF